MTRPNTIDYLRAADAPFLGTPVRIKIITNFTDAILAKLLRGVLAHEGIAAEVETAPYKQYHMLLKNGAAHASESAITFVFFDVTTHAPSPFTLDKEHASEVVGDLVRYAIETASPLVVATFPLPYRGAYGNLFRSDTLYEQIEKANAALFAAAKEHTNLYVVDVNALLAHAGERHARDHRGLHAFDVPFTHDFFLRVAEEWASYVRAMHGKTKKCIVLDLDNTLWGGIVGEVGASGIALGPEYPGSAFVAFQHALRTFRERGVLLAINSKNNASDVDEVFEKNPNMVLKKSDFASVQMNWDDKAKNMLQIAKELNIGTDSLVFLDDDPVNRELVRTLLPEVTVPDLPTTPEEYTDALYEITPLFNQFSLTDEDVRKSEQYAEERARDAVRYSVKNVEDYIRELDIHIVPELNQKASVPRIAQLTQKTNQFNLTTKRYTEADIEAYMGTARVYAGTVSDRFGNYGKTILAIVIDYGKQGATLDTFLMSCRVMGRGVEYAFMAYLADELIREGKTELRLSYIPTLKNDPARAFFDEIGGKDSLNLETVLAKARTKQGSITIDV